MLIEQLIGDLLLRHNCVVVPAFGGFVAKQASAVLDSRNGIMLPPKKSLLFNKQLINNDGLLIASFAKETGKSYNEAAAEITAQVEKWQHALNSGERITLEKVGYLFLDQEKNIGFEQDRFFNLLLQSYGLGKVHFISEEDIQIVAQPEIRINPVEKPVTEKQEAPIIELIPEGISIAEPVEGEPRIIPMPERTPSRKLWRYVAAAAFLPIAFYSYWIPMKTKVLESGVFAVQDFNPFHTEQNGTYESKNWDFKPDTNQEKPLSVDKEIASLATDISTWSYPFDENLYMPMFVKEVAAPETSTTASNNMATETGSFHLIVNCFGNEENAKNFVTLLKSKGLNAYVVDIKNGLHRVSAGRAANPEALSNLQKETDALQLEGTWILKK